MTPDDLRRRFTRLDQLGRGLAKEESAIRLGYAPDPMLRAERQEYLTQLRAAIAGIEQARVLIARVLVRLEREGG